MTQWKYFDKFEGITSKYLPECGEGETMATQIVTAVCKLVYKWYNDGDVYDNTYRLQGWCNDLSSYANWLSKYADCENTLTMIAGCEDEVDYESLLIELANETLDEDKLAEMNKIPKQGSVYECEGAFRFEYRDEEDEDDEW